MSRLNYVSIPKRPTIPLPESHGLTETHVIKLSKQDPFPLRLLSGVLCGLWICIGIPILLSFPSLCLVIIKSGYPKLYSLSLIAFIPIALMICSFVFSTLLPQGDELLKKLYALLSRRYSNYLEYRNSRLIHEQNVVVYRKQYDLYQTTVMRSAEEYWDSLSGNQLEDEVTEHLTGQGQRAKKSGGSGDEGVDIQVLGPNDEVLTVVQCKAHKKPISSNFIRELAGARNLKSAANAILVATNGVTSHGKNQAIRLGIDVWDKTHLAKFNLNKLSSKNGNVTVLQPHYPLEARMKKIEGLVAARFIVNQNGSVSSPRILHSSNEIFNDSVFSALNLSWFNAVAPGEYEKTFCFKLAK